VTIDWEGNPADLIFLIDITECRVAQTGVQRAYHIQSVLNVLLQISLESISLEEMLGRIVDRIVSIPWLALESKGSIFLVEDEPEVLVLKGQRGLPESLQAVCARVPFGRCLCGRAAKSGEIEFADCVDERHENQYEGISAHGHYCVPISTPDEKVLGVINLYLKEGHQLNRKETEFLQSVANVLVGIIERKRAEEQVKLTSEQLKIEREALERKNIALREILDQIDAEKNALKRQIATNVAQAIVPTLLRLKESSQPFQKRILEMLEKDLREIVSPLLETLKSDHRNLSRRELEICRLIKNGMRSKEIAEALNLSPWTVYKHRDAIRRKLSLSNSGANLSSYLLSLET
jgi:DNA-binding CsgD family transcriptional regulator/putative methionine-R-sulfoxide reductase with GAF domain